MENLPSSPSPPLPPCCVSKACVFRIGGCGMGRVASDTQCHQRNQDRSSGDRQGDGANSAGWRDCEKREAMAGAGWLGEGEAS